MLRVALTIIALTGALLSEIACAETPTGSNADTRVVVSLQVKPEAAQQWLTGPWQVNPVPSGPSKGANAVLVFVDQQLVLDADGKPAGSGINRLLALVVPGKQCWDGRNGHRGRTHLQCRSGVRPESLQDRGSGSDPT